MIQGEDCHLPGVHPAHRIDGGVAHQVPGHPVKLQIESQLLPIPGGPGHIVRPVGLGGQNGPGQSVGGKVGGALGGGRPGLRPVRAGTEKGQQQGQQSSHGVSLFPSK